jgi:uncharacterized protein YqfA (UPF0365 family)
VDNKFERGVKMSPEIISFLLVFFTVILTFIFVLPWKTYFLAKNSGLNVSMAYLAGMRIRKVDPDLIVKSAIISHKAGADVSLEDIEAHYLGGGHVEEIAKAFLEAKKLNIDVSFKVLSAIDLCGRNVVQAIKQCSELKNFNSDYVSFKSKDGKEYRVSINITLRFNLHKIIGGKDDQALVDKIFEYIGKRISDSDSESSEAISSNALEKEILQDSFTEGFCCDIESLRINM